MGKCNRESEVDSALARFILAEKESSNARATVKVDPDAEFLFARYEALAKGNLSPNERSELISYIRSTPEGYKQWLVFQSNLEPDTKSDLETGTVGAMKRVIDVSRICAAYKSIFRLPVYISAMSGFMLAVLVLPFIDFGEINDPAPPLVLSDPVISPPKASISLEPVSSGEVVDDVYQQGYQADLSICKTFRETLYCLQSETVGSKLIVDPGAERILFLTFGDSHVSDFVVGQHQEIAVVHVLQDGYQVALYDMPEGFGVVSAEPVDVLAYIGKQAPLLSGVEGDRVDYLKVVNGALVKGSLFFN